MNKIDDDMLKDLRTLHKGLEACEQSCMPWQRHSDEDSTSANVLSQAEEFLIERLVSEETRIALDFKSSELRKIAQEERQKVADMRRAEAAFALASKAAAAAPAAATAITNATAAAAATTAAAAAASTTAASTIIEERIDSVLVVPYQWYPGTNW